jgi:hypothetical protein
MFVACNKIEQQNKLRLLSNSVFGVSYSDMSLTYCSAGMYKYEDFDFLGCDPVWFGRGTNLSEKCLLPSSNHGA